MLTREIFPNSPADFPWFHQSKVIKSDFRFLQRHYSQSLLTARGCVVAPFRNGLPTSKGYFGPTVFTVILQNALCLWDAGYFSKHANFYIFGGLVADGYRYRRLSHRGSRANPK